MILGLYLLFRESDSLGRLLDVYLSQAHYYWQEPDILAWLERNIEVVLHLVEPTVVTSDGTSSMKNQQPDPRLAEYSEK